MMFLVIFSGFWLMFWHIFYALPFYVKDVLHYERFELIEAIDAVDDRPADGADGGRWRAG